MRKTETLCLQMTDCAADHEAVALIAPLGVATEFFVPLGVDLPPGWDSAVLREGRTGQMAALITPPSPEARAAFTYRFADRGDGVLDPVAFQPEDSPLARAAEALAENARALADAAGGGRAGIAAIVADASARFDYGDVPYEDRWYVGEPSVPIVACAAGNCIDINTFLIASLRAAGYRAAYLTCLYIDESPDRIAPGMHCWVRTEYAGVIEDWDIAHFKKVGRADVYATLNPVPGQRFPLAFGRDLQFDWNGVTITLSTPSTPIWVRADGTVSWAAPPLVALVG